MRPTSEQEEFEWIEDYLLGKLNLKDSIFFEEELKDDIELTKKVDQIRKALNLVKESVIQQEVLKTIKLLQYRNKHSSTSAYIKIRKYVTSTSIAALVVFMLYLSFGSIHLPDTENDFNVTRGVDSSKFTPEQRKAFSSFFDGQAHLVEGNYLLAVNDFQKSLELKNIRPYFKEAAEWHLALAYIKSNQPYKAEVIYEKFANCTDCEYPVDTLNRWKIKWRIFWAKIL
ncbi:hypothetical protein [Emticicia sp. TH156]|uniref:hypothetical protein n=1 Tax=Emticicia sp. TH156 TaxID=2067454 RepID=UPI000C781685|nr:hypothetical protein [Emticicia sp. TH156]PLK42432.1 hypothetical protein C0V77_20675 [Emticicia sp. TH156]